MTQEEKAKRYDEAIKRIENIKTGKCEITFMFTEDLFEYIFPELAESEDERIRKAILELVRQSSEILEKKNQEQMIAWLEKQCEKNLVVIIPKFRIGDNIKTTNEEPLTITKIDGKGYWSEDLFICDFGDAAKWELVEQKPAAWSEEDENHIQHISDFIMRNRVGDTDAIYRLEQDVKWLKSLRPKNTWKPSELQLECLDDAIKPYLAKGSRPVILMELLEELKKL